jgi:hypothetical protein
MSDDTPFTRTFRLAIERLGDVEQLARALGASVAEVEAWAAGLAHPPPSKFLKAIDVVSQAGWAPGDRTKL